MQRNNHENNNLVQAAGTGIANNLGWGGNVEDHGSRADHRPDDPPGGSRRLATPPPADDGDGGDAGARNSAGDVPGRGVPPANRGANPKRADRSSKKRSRAAVRIASLNIKGGGLANSRDKWTQISGLMRDESLSILALQETHINGEDLKDIQKLHRRMRIFNTADPNHARGRGGVALALNIHKTKWKNASDKVIVPGRALLVTLEWGDTTKLQILAVYAPSGDDGANKVFWETVEAELRRTGTQIDVLLGDLNMVESGLDRLPARADNAEVVDSFMSMALSQHVHDGWRLANPSRLDYTFRSAPRADGHTSHSRIDRIYVTETLIDQCDEWRIMVTGLRTDHFMVSAYITTNETPFVGKGRSTIPDFLTDYKEVRLGFMSTATRVCSNIARFQENSEPRTDTHNPQVMWAGLKTSLLDQAQESARTRSTKLKKLINKWSKRRKKILEVAEDDLENEEVLHLDEIEETLRDLRAAQILRKSTSIAAKHHALGEAGTKYDYVLHREQKPRDTICALRKPGLVGPPQYEKSTSGMVKIATEHHERLQDEYEHKLEDADWEVQAQEILSTLKPKVSEAESAKMGAEITAEEVSAAIKDIKGGRAPGLDGIPIEVWKYLLVGHPDEQKRDENGRKYRVTAGIEKALAIVLNDIVEHGIAPGTNFAEGWMCPIYKKNDKSDIGNYRPITVLNNDYKILTKILTSRL
ncbi:Endonuclease/exonuclease/phosphatase, partial [Ephemerocybe angulata]